MAQLPLEPRGWFYIHQALSNSTGTGKMSPRLYKLLRSPTLPFPPPGSMKWCSLSLRLKWWLAVMRAPLPVGRGRDPSPLTPEVVRVLKMATPYVTDETGGECGNRGAASPRTRGLGVRTWRGVCATPIPGPLLCHAPVPPSPFIPVGYHLRPLLVSSLGGSLLPVSQTLGVLQCPLLWDP